jgi:restriction endonuclease Mrr
MEVLQILLGLLAVYYVAMGVFAVYHWLRRILETPRQRALRECEEAKETAKKKASAEEWQRELQRRQREADLNEMRDRWALYQNLFRVNAMNDLTAYQFEVLCASFFESKGYIVEIVGGVGDFGVDLIAQRGSEVLAVQVKRYTGNVGPSAIQQVHAGGAYKGCNACAVVASSYFTPAATEMAKRLNIKLYDRPRIGKWLEEQGIGARQQFSEAAYLANKDALDRICYAFQPRSARGQRRYRRNRSR